MDAIAKCAVHEDAHSIGACARCGNYVCPLCLDPASALALHCASCRQRAGDERLPWERDEGGWIRRWAATLRAVVLRPGATFDRVQPGSWLRALGFHAVNSLLLGVALGLVSTVTGAAMLFESGGDLRSLGAGLAAIPLFTTAEHALAPMFYALLFHTGTRIVGGRRTIGVSVWAVSYLFAPTLLLAMLALVQVAVPIFGQLVFLAAVLALTVWLSIRMAHVGRRFYELSPARAAFAAAFPVIVAIVLLFCLCGSIALYHLVTAEA